MDSGPSKKRNCSRRQLELIIERAIMQFFKKKAKSSARVGVVINAEELALAHMGERDDAPYLLHCESVAVESEKDAGIALIKIVKDLGLEGSQCSFVLSPKDYSLHLVEAPPVEPEEMRAAVRWKIKDLLDTKIEETAIDVFEIPQDAYRGRKMVYVVASQKSRIQQIVDRVTESGLELAVIDIPELAMKNMSNHFIEDSQGVAFMDLRRTGSTMNITRNGDLYLTRRINTQLDPDVMQSADWGALKDRLVLEIQRSLDYFESQMGQGQITKIVIVQRQNDTRGMLDSLNEMLTVKVSALDIGNFLNTDIVLTPQMQQICMVAIGATLRGGKGRALPVQPGPDIPDPEFPNPESTDMEAA